MWGENLYYMVREWPTTIWQLFGYLATYKRLIGYLQKNYLVT